MPLEATMLLVDNSSHALNGDYAPTRILAQTDAVNTLFNAKTGSNAENVVGLMSTAGKGPEMLVAPTTEQGKIIAALDDLKSKLYGQADITTSIQIAQLALKHRPNKNQRQRIIVFVGSPLPDSAVESLERVGKKLKKNNVAIDVVLFGSEFENNQVQQGKLEQFVETANSSDNSHFISVPPNGQLLSDAILQSPMLMEDGVQASSSGPSGDAGGGGGGDEFGVDANLDPELAMALRMSLEEEQARQAAAAASSNSAPTTTSTTQSETTPAPTSTTTNTTTTDPSTTTTTTEPSSSVPAPAQAQQEQEQQQQQQQQTSQEDVSMNEDDDEYDEEKELQKALELSMKGDENNNDKDTSMS